MSCWLQRLRGAQLAANDIMYVRTREDGRRRRGRSSGRLFQGTMLEFVWKVRGKSRRNSRKSWCPSLDSNCVHVLNTQTSKLQAAISTAGGTVARCNFDCSRHSCTLQLKLQMAQLHAATSTAVGTVARCNLNYRWHSCTLQLKLQMAQLHAAI
jgi:hypothetical protein